ncbi:MAG: lipoprotein-releasing ABC transporter permease subunit [Porticoccaceae bacterium]|jgi:lipoprotein-releasing system permease protein|nr:lipoprotein-releasing ABC transporter permease subunit [Porticoccaceae bacterium]
MKNSLPWFIGLRYVRSRKEEGFFSLVSVFSFAAMTLGVAALIIVLSVMNGFDREIKERILNVVPHITLTFAKPRADWQGGEKAIDGLAGVVDISPFVDGQAMLSAQGQLQGISLQGIDPGGGGIVETLRENMLSGSLDNLRPGDYGVVLGSLLARSLNVVSGDEVLLTLPQMTLTPVGVFPRVKNLRVVGVYQVGAQVDTGIALVHVADAQKLLRLGNGYEGLRISVADPFNLNDQVAALATVADSPGEGGTITTWQQAMKTLFAAIKMEKTVVGLLLCVIIAVAGFNIVASLVLMVASKRKDIAVLRAMGATSATVTGIFRVQGTVAGISGVALGVVAGCLIAWKLGVIVNAIEKLIGKTLFDPEVYFISQLPSVLLWQDVAIIAGFGVLISILATLYPAYRAGQVSPSEVLRYEH